MNELTLRLSRSGTPLAGWDVAIDGYPAPARTDGRGLVAVRIEAGRHKGRVERAGESLDFEFVCAPGLADLHVDLRVDENEITDPAVLAAMPSDRYRPLRLLGEGAAGAVYKCRDEVLDRIVAVKLLRPETIGGGNAREAFLAEARALAKLEHDALISIYDMGFVGDQGYLVTRFVDGPDLDTLIQAEGPLQLPSLKVVGERLARSLSAIHELGFVHLDVKPSNCLVDRKGRVFLGDFGLATRLEEVVDERDEVSGTPPYMAPELVQGLQVGPATDVYALGATLYHLATGVLPFQEVGPALLRAHVVNPVESMTLLRPELPAWFDDLVLRMLAKDPADRPTDRELVTAFKDAPESALDTTLGAFDPRRETEMVQVRPLVEAWTQSGIVSLPVGSTTLLPLDQEPPLDEDTLGIEPDEAIPSVEPTRIVPVQPRRRPTARLALAGLGLLVVLGGMALFLSGPEAPDPGAEPPSTPMTDSEEPRSSTPNEPSAEPDDPAFFAPPAAEPERASPGDPPKASKPVAPAPGPSEAPRARVVEVRAPAPAPTVATPEVDAPPEPTPAMPEPAEEPESSSPPEAAPVAEAVKADATPEPAAEPDDAGGEPEPTPEPEPAAAEEPEPTPEPPSEEKEDEEPVRPPISF